MNAKKIMIIEDDTDTQLFLGEFLREENFEVVTASHGKEALQYLSQEKTPDLIFMDLNFPHMTAAEFIQEVRKHPSMTQTPVYLLSGKSDIEKCARDLEATGFLKKPFDLNPLLDIVATLQ